MLEDLIENEADENSCMLLLDQEKAFDRVEFTWLFKTLDSFGFEKKTSNGLKYYTKMQTAPYVQMVEYLAFFQ